jgi:hypothetical protein
MLDIWQRALESPNGVRLKLLDEVQARDIRARLYHARAAQRRAHLKVYPEGDPMRGKSFYEHLTAKRQGAELLIVPGTLDFELEEL